MRLSSECGGKDRRRGNNFADALRKYGGVDPTGIYDDSDADQRAAGSSSFWWTGGYDAAWRPDADNPSLEKILPFLETTQNVQGETSEEL